MRHIVPPLLDRHSPFTHKCGNSRSPLRFEFALSCATKKRGSVAATCNPVLLLPPGETWRAKTDFFDDRLRNRRSAAIRTDACRIGEFCAKTHVRRAIRDTPGTNRIG